MNAAATQNFHLIDDMDVSVMIYAAVERIQGLGARIGRKVRILECRANERRAMARLNDRMLADAGLTRAEIEREARKYFWQK